MVSRCLPQRGRGRGRGRRRRRRRGGVFLGGARGTWDASALHRHRPSPFASTTGLDWTPSPPAQSAPRSRRAGRALSGRASGRRGAGRGGGSAGPFLKWNSERRERAGRGSGGTRRRRLRGGTHRPAGGRLALGARGEPAQGAGAPAPRGARAPGAEAGGGARPQQRAGRPGAPENPPKRPPGPPPEQARPGAPAGHHPAPGLFFWRPFFGPYFLGQPVTSQATLGRPQVKLRASAPSHSGRATRQ